MGKARQLAAPRPNPARYNPLTDRVRAEPLVLVVCPTRELACQIFDEARRLCYRTMLRPCVVYGGAPTRNQREQLEMGCDILIATPGRLMDFMQNLNLLSFRRLKFTVIDEADELLSSGWEEAMEKLFSGSGMFAFFHFVAACSPCCRCQRGCRSHLPYVLGYLPKVGSPSCEGIYGSGLPPHQGRSCWFHPSEHYTDHRLRRRA